MRQIYVVGNNNSYACWMQGEITTDMAKADVVVWTGGEDVSPALYNRMRNPMTMSNMTRDEAEVKEYRRARELNKPMVGICRGAQFLCVCAGGLLVQHQENRLANHMIKTSSGELLTITSDHHQAQFPWILNDYDYKILAWTKGLCAFHESEKTGSEMVYAGDPCQDREVEIAYYILENSLCIQGHPEWMYSKMNLHKPTAATIAYCRDLLDLLILDRLCL